MDLKDCIKGKFYVYIHDSDKIEYTGLSLGGKNCRQYVGAGRYWNNGNHWENVDVRPATNIEKDFLINCIKANRYTTKPTSYLRYLLNKHSKKWK